MTQSIDDLLARVSPALVAGYEAKNLPEGKTLKTISEEQEFLGKRYKKSRNLSLLYFVLMFIVPAFTVVVVGPVSPKLTSIVLSVVASEAALFGILMLFFQMRKVPSRHFYENERLLNAFREAAEQLRPIGTFGGYTENSVRAVLIIRAGEVATAQKARLRNSNKDRLTVLAYCAAEGRLCDEFDKVLQAAEKFGLTWGSGELFQAAERNLKNRAE